MNPFMTAPFRPHGDTVTRGATTSSARSALTRAKDQTVIIKADPANSVMVFVKFGDSTVVATTAAFPILPGEIFSASIREDETHVAAITASSTGSILVTVGDGV